MLSLSKHQNKTDVKCSTSANATVKKKRLAELQQRPRQIRIKDLHLKTEQSLPQPAGYTLGKKDKKPVMSMKL